MIIYNILAQISFTFYDLRKLWFWFVFFGLSKCIQQRIDGLDSSVCWTTPSNPHGTDGVMLVRAIIRIEVWWAFSMCGSVLVRIIALHPNTSSLLALGDVVIRMTSECFYCPNQKFLIDEYTGYWSILTICMSKLPLSN